jgi:hypothetical protein
MQLQYAVGYDVIDALEGAMANAARQSWSSHPNIVVAGSSTGKRVGIVSFQVCLYAVLMLRFLAMNEQETS